MCSPIELIIVHLPWRRHVDYHSRNCWYSTVVLHCFTLLLFKKITFKCLVNSRKIYIMKEWEWATCITTKHSLDQNLKQSWSQTPRTDILSHRYHVSIIINHWYHCCNGKQWYLYILFLLLTTKNIWWGYHNSFKFGIVYLEQII